jgi:WD40 repeat protein
MSDYPLDIPSSYNSQKVGLFGPTFYLGANASRRRVTKTDLLRLFKMHSDLSCTTKGQSRVILFSPTGSLIRQLFQHEEPKGVCVRPTMRDDWSACLQTLEGHGDSVYSVAFSHDSTRLASASYDSTIKSWDASSGACLQDARGPWRFGLVRGLLARLDATGVGVLDRTVKIWDASSGACLQTLEGHGRDVSSADLVSILALLHSNRTVINP